MRHRRTGTEEPVSVSLDADLSRMQMDGWLGEVGETVWKMEARTGSRCVGYRTAAC